MKILVTGNQGYIGTKLTEYFLKIRIIVFAVLILDILKNVLLMIILKIKI